MRMVNIQKRLAVIIVLIFVLLVSACAVSNGDSDTMNEGGTESEPTSLSADETEILGSSSLPSEHWFQPTDFMLASWNIDLDDSNDVIVRLIPVGESSENLQKIFFLYTKPNIAFDQSVSQALSVFQSRGVPVEAVVFLATLGDEVDGDQAGFEALDYAEENGFDIIFSMGSSTTAFIHDNYRGGELPVVSILSKDPVLRGQMPDYDSGSGTNIAYTSVGVPTAVQMNYFSELVPGLENIVVIYEQDNTSTVEAEVTPLDGIAAYSGINVIHVAVADPEQVVTELQVSLTSAIDEIRSIDPEGNRSLVLVTNSASIVDSITVVDSIAGDFPIVGLRPALVQEGTISAVLSVGVSFDSNSILAGLYGVRILIDGENPGNLPVGVIKPPDLAINFAKARALNLKIPFEFFESATILFGPDGTLVREKGQ